MEPNLARVKHPFLLKYPVSKSSKYLILGTHPPMPAFQSLDFFYGNMADWWRLLSIVYPVEILYKDGILDLELILNFLNKYQLSITDMVYETDGSPFSTDAQMGIVMLNPFLFSWLEDSDIETIYCTSFSGKRNTFDLFKKAYRLKFKKPLKLDNEGYCEISNKRVRIVKLYSPSKTAVRGILGSPTYKNWLRENPKGDVDQFRIDWYRRFLPACNK